MIRYSTKPCAVCLCGISWLFAQALCDAQAPPPYTITTVAGQAGVSGFAGDGGTATSAELAGPFGIVVDSDGNLYIADQFNDRIRKVSNSTISTVAGNGTAGFTGDGGSPTSAELNSPSGLALDFRGQSLHRGR